ncbi:MAG: hypothetical protein ACOY31_00020 [Bacillota bacterium]
MLDNFLGDLRRYLDGIGKIYGVSETRPSTKLPWPSGEGRNVVLIRDTGVELGNPEQESLSLVMWVNNPDLVRDGVISLIGPDLPESRGGSLPFGKVVIAGVCGFNGENSYERYREMDLLRFDVDLKGYMMRAVSQYRREWSRVSHEALDRGFSFDVLGGALIDRFREKDYVKSVEVVFVTAGSEEVRKLRGVTEKAMKAVDALNRMSVEMSFDCGDCEYNDVCSQVGDLRKMRNSLKGKR